MKEAPGPISLALPRESSKAARGLPKLLPGVAARWPEAGRRDAIEASY